MRYRINETIAKQLGLEVNKSGRYRISKEQEKEYFKIKSETDSNNYQSKSNTHFTAIADNGSLMNIQQYCEYYGLDYSKIRSWKLITHSSVPFYNVVFYETFEEKDDTFREDLIRDLQQYSPKFPKLERIESNDSYLLVIDPADVHMVSYVQPLK